MKVMLDLIGQERLDEVTDFLVGEVRKLSRAGADIALLASNTPHIVFDRIAAVSPLPLISIVAVTCRKAVGMGLQRVGLFGTQFTMQSGIYGEAFSEHDISVVTPPKAAQDYIHNKYMTELVKGIIRGDTKRELLKIARDLKADHGIDGLILGGTELPLILKDTDDLGIPLLDTTRIHVESIVERLLGAE